MLKKILFLLLIAAAVFAQNGKISSSLKFTLAQTGIDETVKIWIYFSDKGNVSAQDFLRAEDNLLPKARARRAKVMHKKLADIHDLPLNNDYLNKVRNEVNRIVIKSKWLNAVSAEVNMLQIDALANLPFVKKIDLVKSYKKNYPQDNSTTQIISPEKTAKSLDYGASFTQNNQISVPQVHDLGINGSGVLICMLDNNFVNLGHEAFSTMDIQATWDFIHADSTVDDPGEGTHGTQTLSTVGAYKSGELIGPAYGASFILGKTEVDGSETPIEEDYWVAGAEWADSLGADIISSSLGYIDWYTWQNMDGNTAVTTKGADIAVKRGIVVVNSAGNEGSSSASQPNTLIAPADGDSVIAVGAVGSSGSRVYFSSMGPTVDGRIKPDVMAMGSGVTVVSAYSTNDYTTSSGTSFSCPLTSGVVALILSANPGLTPMQVRDALRNSADNSANPNNEYGWGIINAWDAVFYYTPQFSHFPHGDTEDLNGPYEIVVNIESSIPLVGPELKLHWSSDLSFNNEVVLTATGNTNEYSGQFTGTGTVNTYNYYFSAKNDQQIQASYPFNAPTEHFSFYAGPDTISPVILHSQLRNQSLMRWPATVKANVSDNQGIDSVWVEYRINSGNINHFGLTKIGNELFEADFPVNVSTLSDGDVFEYRLHAKDKSSIQNTSVEPVSGYFSFEMMDVLGLAMVINDDAGTVADKNGKPVYTRNTKQIGAASDRFYRILNNMGFLADTQTSSALDTSMLGQYNLVVCSSGGDTGPVSSEALRQKLENWLSENPGNKLLIEGGEVGYDALSYPGYPDFAANVLHSFDWESDNAGSLNLSTSYQNHPIANTPNTIPSSIAINYGGWGDEDAIVAAPEAYVVYGTTSYPSAGGIIVYDDDTDPDNAQMVYMTFNIEALADTNISNLLIENAVSFLMHQAVTDISASATELPIRFELYQNYPNPFNPETSIKFALATPGNVNLQIFNSIGENIDEAKLGHRNSGVHSFKYSNNNLSSGVYFYQLTARSIETGETYKAIKKMVYLK